MTSIVKVEMKTCSKRHRIEVSMREDGDLDVKIKSDCKNVQEYARRVKRLTLEDATDYRTSKIFDPDYREPLSLTCLCPPALMNACWKELGMISKSICTQAHSNEVILDIYEDNDNPEEDKDLV